ncbi:unnamed protein product [Linum trigynum]|uniref:Uncharacterized protein n=1 Tax=Linum trigynum TaxID=586398 RepID=A0AAV2CDZ9_9ROSI
MLIFWCQDTLPNRRQHRHEDPWMTWWRREVLEVVLPLCNEELVGWLADVVFVDWKKIASGNSQQTASLGEFAEILQTSNEISIDGGFILRERITCCVG